MAQPNHFASENSFIHTKQSQFYYHLCTRAYVVHVYECRRRSWPFGERETWAIVIAFVDVSFGIHRRMFLRATCEYHTERVSRVLFHTGHKCWRDANKEAQIDKNKKIIDIVDAELITIHNLILLLRESVIIIIR